MCVCVHVCVHVYVRMCVSCVQGTRRLLVDTMAKLFQDMQVLTGAVHAASVRFAHCHHTASTLHDDALEIMGRYSVAQRSRDRIHALPMAFK